MAGFGTAFFGYFGVVYLLHKNKNIALPFSYFIGLAVLLRLVLLPAFPSLSDDLYRFIWDGYLIHEGVNPLTFTPRSIVESNILESAELNALLPLLNSPDYFTIYPPISQAVFYLSTITGAADYFICAIIIKVILLLAELFSLVAMSKLLFFFDLKKSNLLIYALNPLVIVEVMTNLHFEAIMVCFFLWSILSLLRFKYMVSSLFMACAVAAKLLPLMFMPAVLMFLVEKKKWTQYLLYFTAFSLILFLPFFMTLDVQNFMKSIDLYFQKFEFNASIYYLLRAVGKFLTGYNQIVVIGPLLGLTTVLLILKKVYATTFKSGLDLISVCLFAFVTYLFLTTTVHPWYLILPLALSVFNPRWYLLVWSFLITLSYSTYATPDFTQNYYLISLEYFVVFSIMIFELKPRLSSHPILG